MATLDEILGAVYRKDYGTLSRLTRTEVNMIDGDSRTPLMHAILAEDADPSIVKLLLAHGADVNAVDRGQKWTPLHFAVRDGNEKIVEQLLDAGASVDATNVFGNTPLWEHIKSPKRDPRIIQILTAHGANPNKKNNHGVSPIDLALRMGRDDLASVLEQTEK